jgi:CRISPR-associated protein Cas2
MTTLIANDTPPAIRGLLKRWFIEPRPNVFVGTLNPRTHRKVIDYILRHAPREFGVLIIASAPNCQGYTIERIGPCGCSGRDAVELSGISLIAESPESPQAAELPELAGPFKSINPINLPESQNHPQSPPDQSWEAAGSSDDPPF